jgi:hypothetical protein
VLDFSPSRSGAILYEFFPRNWSGEVQTDGASMYPRAFKHRPNILHIECIGHLRRYVLEAIKADEKQALPLLKDISELYRIERQATDLGLRHERRGPHRSERDRALLPPDKSGFTKLPVHRSPQGGMAIGSYLQHHRDVSTVRGEPGSVPALGAPETGRCHQQDGERSPASRFYTVATTDEQHHGMRTVTFVLID